MTEQEIRHMVREELVATFKQIARDEIVAAFKELYNIADEHVALADRWGTCYGTRPKYDTKQCFAELARRLAIDAEQND